MTLTAKDVVEITRLLEESNFDELYLELDGLKLSLRRGSAATVQPLGNGGGSAFAAPVPGATAATAAASGGPAPAPATVPAPASNTTTIHGGSFQTVRSRPALTPCITLYARASFS